jgi:glycerol kinase
LTKPETLNKVNTADAHVFECEISEPQRLKMIRGWERAVDRARKWHTAEEEDEEEEAYEAKTGLQRVQ